MRTLCLAIFVLIVSYPIGAVRAETLLDINPGMSYGTVKGYVMNDPHLSFLQFDENSLIISDKPRAYVPGIQFDVTFCPGSKYDGKVFTVVARKTYNSTNPNAPIDMIHTYHDIFLMMADQVFVGTHTEYERERREGYSGVSIHHNLRSGENWELGIFNRPETNTQEIQLTRLRPCDTDSK
jgi:hypothetical protein